MSIQGALRAGLLLLGLLTGPALAQTFPITLPANTIYGRLGIGPGPGQAIPFATLGAQINGALNGGVARMFPRAGQTAAASDCYTLIDPLGRAIACTTSTTTQGLQEFMNTAAANGWPAVVNCQGTQFPSLAEPVLIEATTSVTVPVSQDWSFHSYGCNLNFNVTTVSGLIVDSQGASVFDWDGKIVYNVSAPNGNTTTNPSCVILIKPTTNTADGFAGLYGGLFRVKSPVTNPQGGTKNTGVICVNTAGGSVIQGPLDFTEINANNVAYYGVLAFGATGSTGLLQNPIRITQIHGAFLHAIDIGFNGTNQANYNGNHWQVENFQNADTASRCIDTWGSGDIFDVGLCNGAQGGLGTGFVAESGAAYNKFRYGAVTGYTTLDWADSGTCNEFSGGSGLTGSSSGSKSIMVGGTSGCTAVKPAAVASGTLTLPAATDTLVARATTDTLTNKTLTAPTINGGTHTAATLLGIRSTGAAFDISLAATEVLTAGRVLTFILNDAARTINLGGGLTTAAAFTTAGANPLTLTTTGSTNVTLPLTGTLATLAGAETLSNKSIVGTATNDNAPAGSVGEYRVSSCPSQTATVTITIASPAVVTYTASGLINNASETDACPIIFTNSGGALPTGITSGTTYWTIPASIATSTFQIATSVANAIAGTAVNTSGSQSGTQTGTFNVGLVTATAKNITGLALTAGDWDCTGNTLDTPAGSTVVTAVNASIGTVADTLTSPWAAAYASSQYSSAAGVARVTALSTGRFSLGAPANLYLVANNSFTTAAEGAVGILRCRRVR